MRILPEIPTIEIKEQKPNSYTDTKKYVVIINGERQLSGDTKEQALINSIVFMFRYKKQYEIDYNELIQAIGPLNKVLKKHDQECLEYDQD